MVAIPQEEYTKLTSVQQVRQPMTQQFYNLERQYGEQERIRDPYQRMMMQSETMESMKDLKERMRQDLTAATPKPYQSRALALYQSLQPYIKFNERGEVHDEDGTLIPDSRLEDLVQHAIRDRRRAMVPTGWGQFLNLIRSENVPRFMLNRDTLEELSTPKIKTEPKSSITPTRATARALKSEVNIRRKLKKEIKRSPSIQHERVKQRPKSIPPRLTSKRIKKENTRYGEKYGFVKNY